MDEDHEGIRTVAEDAEPWHFRNALFEDVSRDRFSVGKPITTKNSGGSLSRQRYPCLACGEVKRWDQLTQHYKKLVQFDSLGIPSVPDQRQMPEKVYLHTALFFEKNFHRDRMPTYKDHTIAELADCTSPTSSSQSTSFTSPLISPTKELFSFSQTPLMFPPNFAFLLPTLQSANYSTEKTQCRKRRTTSHNSTNSSAPSKPHPASPSQSRRFYNCLGCGAAKRWDRLTDHYRKYVMFGALGRPLPPSLDTMTPEQFVHTMTFREQGFTSDKMPQYRDHTEAGQDVTSEASSQSPVKSSEKLLTFTPRALSQPNMEIFWENKHFADCKIVCKGGEEVLTHRLVLAAHNEYLYQLLTSTASVDQDMEVILMPDHSREDVVNMVEKLYTFKVENSAFLLDQSLHDYRITDSIPSAIMKKISRISTIKDSKNTTRISNTSINSSECLLESAGIPSHPGAEESDVSGGAKLDGKRELIESFISKSGSELSPTYSCQVPGCLFSVEKSLLCIKGHILAEHWSNVSE